MSRKKMQDTTLDTFDDILNDGTLGIMSEKARSLVENNPDKTARELLRIGVREGIYSRTDRNLIAPRLTLLAEDGIIVRPRKRVCAISGRRVMIHELAPESWKTHRKTLYRSHVGPYVKNRIETESKSKPGTYHTTIEWTDGSISCTCDKLYHRSIALRCHHALGMIQATTGSTPKEKELKEELAKMTEKMQHYATFSISSHEVAQLYSDWKKK